MYRDADVEGILICEDQGCVRRLVVVIYFWVAREIFGGERLTGEHDRVGALVEIFPEHRLF